jgi:hypothetical protein
MDQLVTSLVEMSCLLRWMRTWQPLALSGNHVALMWQSRGSNMVLTWQPRGADVAIYVDDDVAKFYITT